MDNYTVSFLGDEGVGKTSVINSLFHEPYDQYSNNFVSKKYMKPDTDLQIDLWEFSGNRGYIDGIKNELKLTDYCVILYDSTNKTSYKNAINFWINVAKEYVNDSKIIMFATKSDLKPVMNIPSNHIYKNAKKDDIYFEFFTTLFKN